MMGRDEIGLETGDRGDQETHHVPTKQGSAQGGQGMGRVTWETYVLLCELGSRF